MRLIDADALKQLTTKRNRIWDGVTDSCGRGLTEIIDSLPTIDHAKWIPCKERLPKEEKMQYWVCTDTGYQCQCRWTNDVYGLGASDEWEWKIFDIPQYQKVVAWMPLPEPWRGEEDE